MTYYDHHIGRERYKRRYVWAFWAFIAGTAMGMLLGAVL